MSDHPEADNIGLLCPKHSRKKGKFVNVPCEDFVGKTVQVGFPTDLENGPGQENMWVEVHEVIPGLHEGGPGLRGKLINTPMFCDLVWGDTVSFTVNEILQVSNDA